MPSSLYGPKTLSRWLELDYFKRPRRLRWLWRIVLWSTLVVSLTGVLAWALPPSQRRAFQAGPVSMAHSMFDNQCDACHTGEQRTFDRLVRLNPALRSVPDAACLKCHSGAVHNPRQIGEQRCATCHKEHRGRQELVRVEDGHCTTCHGDLKVNDGEPLLYDAHITAFAPGKHPDFRLFAQGAPTDPGTIKFNHKVHLVPEGVWTIDEKKRLQRQEDLARGWLKENRPGAQLYIDDVERDLKRREVLNCQDCHRTDAAGRYMQPINFDQHCKRCHPVAVQLIGDWTGAKQHELARGFSRVPAPHPAPDQSAEVVRGVVRDRLARFIAAAGNAEAFLKGPLRAEPPRPIPGMPRLADLGREEHEWVNRQQNEIEHQLFDGPGGCRFCHTEKAPGAPGRNGLPEYLPSRTAKRWYEHAVFSHKSHQMLNCAECHAAAESARASDVLLPRMETCLKCHEAQGRRARSDCVECHNYHPEQGHGFRGRLTIEGALGR